jgi:hypothetical protein
METMEYNGWTNRETWAVALWIDNDYSLQETATEYARTEIEGHDKDEEINPYYLGESLKTYIEEDLLTFENVSQNQTLWMMLTDIGSLYRVNWREIADHYLTQAKEEAVA